MLSLKLLKVGEKEFYSQPFGYRASQPNNVNREQVAGNSLE